MREDGDIMVFRIEFRATKKQWHTADVAHFLFRALSHQERRGEIGDTYRELIAPMHDCWQHTGETAFERVEDALRMHNALRKRCPDDRFRIVKQHMSQSTEVVKP